MMRENRDSSNHLDEQPTKRQRMHFTPKHSPRLDQLMPQQRIDLIASLSESILEDPSAGLTSSRAEVPSSGGAEKIDDNEPNPIKDPQYYKIQSKMNKLLDLASLSHNGHDSHAARLALLSLLAVFQDILPSYRIRLPTEAEMSVKVSKEIKATWDYERKLLQAYRRYQQLLQKTWDDGKFGIRWSGGKEVNAQQGGRPPTNLSATAILSLSALLQTSYNFNFRTNLLQVVIRQANNRSSEEVRYSCCNSLSIMFTNDVQGDASLEAVRLIAKMIQQFTTNRGPKAVHPDLLNTWLSIPLRVHEDEAIAVKLASVAKSRKTNKSQQDKDTMDIEKEMKEGEVTVNKMDLAKNQADCLHTVTLTYFRLLKLTCQECNNPSSSNNSNSNGLLELLPCALHGLSTFSHLIHLDAVVDLLSVIKSLLKHVSSLPPNAAMHCTLCAFKTFLRSPGRETLPVDPKDYLIPLYNILPRLGVTKIISETGSQLVGGALISSIRSDNAIDIAIQCLDHAFLQRRELSMARLAAFLKRLASTSLHCPPHVGCPLLACARLISARYPASKVKRMLENEEDIVAEEMFSPDAEDPEHCNAHASSLWELSLLRYSVHPKMADHSIAMSEGRLLKLPGEAPIKILASMERDVEEVFIPHRAIWKKHPLDNKFRDAGTVKMDSGRKRKLGRNQNQIRFITPRRTAVFATLVTEFGLRP